MICRTLCIVFSFAVYLAISTAWLRDSKEDRIQVFYERLKKQDVKRCEDRTRLLPDCNECIPGLKENGLGAKSCDQFTGPSTDIRNEISKLTHERYGSQIKSSRPFGLYPYLELPDFMTRQEFFGAQLSDMNAMNIVDIGAYYNPVLFFLKPNHCPDSMVVIEPILDPLSAYVPCGNKMTHVVFLPITFRFYIAVKSKFQTPDAVVCIGCDSHYGPNRRMLENTFARPFVLLLEYPSEYVHNGPYKKMGLGHGENMTYTRKFQPNTTETQYTKRMMKIIRYAN